MSALLSAGLSAGVSLVGGLFGQSSANKAAKKQHNNNLEYITRLRNVQDYLADKNYAQTTAVNDRVSAHNADVLANHSTEHRTETREENTRNTTSTVGAIDFGRLVKDAEASGFNPLTVLRAGGLAGYATSNTVSDTNFNSLFTSTYKPVRELMSFISPSETPMAPGMPAAPQYQSVNAVGDALQAGLTAYNAYDPLAAQKAELEMGLARAQIANYNSDSALNRHRMTVPSWTAPSRVTTRGGVNGGGGVLGSQPTPEIGEVKVTNPHFFGGNVNPNLVDASAWEERYGDIAQEVGGAINAGGDLYYRHKDQVIDGAKYLRDTYNALTASWGRSNTDGASSAPAP